MQHKEDDILWKRDIPDDFGRFSSQENLYEKLEASDNLRNAIYEPDKLQQKSNQAKTNIINTKFEQIDFSRTEISGIRFKDCQFVQCLFIGSVISNCEFHNCKFILTNTHKISISETYIDPTSFKECLSPKKHQNIGVHLYQALLKNSRRAEQIEFVRDSHFLFLRWKRYQDGWELSRSTKNKNWPNLRKWLLKYIKRITWEIFLGYGIRIRYFSITAAAIIIILSAFNYCFREELGLKEEESLILTCVDALYFTTISLTTLGYGDITPTTQLGKFIASGQSVLGFCFFAVFASMLFRRFSP